MTGLAPTAAVALGGDVLVLSTGDVRIPVHPQDAGPAAPRRGDQAYRPPAGMPELREAVAAHLTGTGKAVVRPAEVLIAPGARLAIWSVLAALPGDRRDVLLPVPYWSSYPALIAASGGRPVTVAGPGGLLDALAAARTPGTGMVVVNSPRNPDGQVIGAEPLAELTEWAARHGLILLFDQVYRGVPHQGGRAPSVLDLGSALPEHCVVIDGLSKSHALAGLRVGWAVAAPDLLARATGHASHVIGGTSSAAQDAALRALADTAATGAALAPPLAANLAAALRALDGLPGVGCVPPAGGLFVLADLRGWLARQAPPAARTDLTRWLREEHRVSVVDGAAFGAPGHVRLSFALPAAQLATGLARLRAALGGLGAPGDLGSGS